MSEKTLDRIRKEYPEGTRVKLVRMDDPQAPPKGTYGTVIGVDDTGGLLVRWDTGSGLKLLYGIDEFKKAEGDGENHDAL